jgi:hypothetical protein
MLSAKKHQNHLSDNSVSKLISLLEQHTMLHKNLHLYPYYVAGVQELKPADYSKRLNLCK